MVEILVKKLTKVGNGYFAHIPKALIDCKVINPNESYWFEVTDLNRKVNKQNKKINSGLETNPSQFFSWNAQAQNLLAKL